MPKEEFHPNEEKNTRSLVSVRELFDKIQKPLKNVAENVFAEIDKIHYISQVSKIDLVQVNAESFDGEFEFYKMGRGIRIKISSRAVNKEFALLHEIGHFIDNQILGTNGVNESEVAGGTLGEILKAIDSTEMIRKLRQMQKTGKYELMGRVRKLTLKQLVDVGYLLAPSEKWAMGYAQYIALKTGNILMLTQLGREINANETIPIHWQNDDFKIITFAIDNFIIEQKWLKQF